MKTHQIVIDTNVIVTALRSNAGASFKLLSLVGTNAFDINLSVPLLFEYEDVCKRQSQANGLTELDIDDILDYLCSVANHRQIFFLWRPFLKDVKDDLVLELAVEANCEYIVTYNIKDFSGSEKFGVKIVTPKEFLKILEVIK